MDAEDQAMRRWSSLVCAALLLCATAAYAHVGSPDVYANGQAGPYRLSIVVRPPLVIPGVAEIEVHAETAGIDHIAIAPVPLTGEAARHPPVPDSMERPSNDAQFFSGHLWIMAPGSWQIRFAVSGSQGTGTLSIPLPATAIVTRAMTPGLGILLAALGLLLVLGMVGIVGAAAREARLEPGAAVPQPNRRRAIVAMAVTCALLIAAVVFGNRWWRSDAANYSGNIYKPLQMTTSLKPGNTLDLKLADPGWLRQRRLDDFIPDHNHLMHLYLIRWPQMDVVFHLHPEPMATGEFNLALPSMPAGSYRLYADVVHASGFPETMVAAIELPQISGRPLAGDDAEGLAKPVEQNSNESNVAITSARPVVTQTSHPREQEFKFPDGYTMIWQMPEAMNPKTPESFRFELLNPAGMPPADMALYMGMLGHAAFVKTDGSVFAHIHPSGTMSMAAFMMANPQTQSAGAGMDMSSMPGMEVKNKLPNTVSFPYGFPAPGSYRIFVQMKHGSTIETGIFDADVLSFQ
jgi:hypothetical protein